MKSSVLPSFWTIYAELDENIKKQARKAFELWSQNPFHPSLHFKCINTAEHIWSVCVTLGYRAIGIWEGNSITWFWIGNHDDYEHYFG
jgi:hypothetical protein